MNNFCYAYGISYWKRHILKKMKRLIIILFVAIALLSACSPIKEEHHKTLFFFYPWSTNLTHYFENNIATFERALETKDLRSNRVVVFISQSESKACMYEIKMDRGRCVHDTIARFEEYNYEYTSVEGLVKLLDLAKGAVATPKFAMAIGCHGDAWIPARDMKRSFGGGSVESRIDISTLRDALCRSNIVAEYILFDDCYMSSVEVAYELRDVCGYLIASPAEIMAAGMPFGDIAQDLLGEPNYEAICEDFYKYYANNRSTPYGAIAVTRCDELERLADIVKRINAMGGEPMRDVQFYDGYNPHIFYDLGDYVGAICDDAGLLNEFYAQMDRCIPYKRHTEYVYVYGFGRVKVERYSGISTSVLSENGKCVSYAETSWGKRTL